MNMVGGFILPQLKYLGALSYNGASTSSVTFTGIALDLPSDDRRIVVAFAGTRTNDVGLTLNGSIHNGGAGVINLTQHISVDTRDSSNAVLGGLLSGIIPTNDTDDLTLTTGNGITTFTAALYSLKRLKNTTPHNVQGKTGGPSNPLNLMVTTPVDGVLIGAAGSRGSTDSGSIAGMEVIDHSQLVGSYGTRGGHIPDTDGNTKSLDYTGGTSMKTFCAMSWR